MSLDAVGLDNRVLNSPVVGVGSRVFFVEFADFFYEPGVPLVDFFNLGIFSFIKGKITFFHRDFCTALVPDLLAS